jgi:hypothetical protein
VKGTFFDISHEFASNTQMGSLWLDIKSEISCTYRHVHPEVLTQTQKGLVAYRCFMLRESFRKDGKINSRTIANLTHCNPAEVAERLGYVMS